MYVMKFISIGTHYVILLITISIIEGLRKKSIGVLI